MTDQQPTRGPAAGAPGGAPVDSGGANDRGESARPGPAEPDGPAGPGGPAPAGPGAGAPSGAAAGSTADPASGVPPVLPRLRRSRRTKTIAGVCGGLGRQFDLDPVIFRIVLTVLALAGGIGLIAYGFAWLLIPLDGEDENELRRLLSGRVEGTALTALLFALVGSGLLLSMLNNGPVLFFAVLLSSALAGVCSWSLRKRRVERAGAVVDAAAAQAVADAPPETTAPPSPGGPSWWRDPIVKDGTTGLPGTGCTGYLWGPDDGPDAGPYGPRAAAAGASCGGRRGLGGPWTGGWTFLAAVLAAVTGTLLTWESEPLTSSLQTGLAAALAVFGLGLAVAAWYGRAGGGTVVAAVLTCGLLVGAGSLPESVTTHWRQTAWRPASVADVRPVYGHGTGRAELDLSALDLGKDETVATRASVGAGELLVLVPPDAVLELTVDIGLGDSRLPGDPPDDIDVEPGTTRSVTLRPEGGRTPAGTLVLELEAGLGRVEVERAAP
ncbi:PspC domain-containing protein [Streptomyces sp. F63]|uniref:PspC domain-containing protein n=1 Tax=Streptomyces sp. F63 TaxID=2824887 RepID=UPI001B39285C|nr:PspC domain-containing protein [Streptomyces sp. F63]MBQ0986042.1 PspC domain-containing protein [Streptomyces sp. F63]